MCQLIIFTADDNGIYGNQVAVFEKHVRARKQGARLRAETRGEEGIEEGVGFENCTYNVDEYIFKNLLKVQFIKCV